MQIYVRVYTFEWQVMTDRKVICLRCTKENWDRRRGGSTAIFYRGSIWCHRNFRFLKASEIPPKNCLYKLEHLIC